MTEHQALRSLRDCGVIRAKPWAPGYHDLVIAKLATARASRGDGIFADFRLTKLGRAKASKMGDA